MPAYMPATRWKADGDRLRSLREARDLSQRELARLAKVDPQTIADIESGKRGRVQSPTLRKLATPLAVDWEDLLLKETARRLGLKRLADEMAPRSTLDVLWYAEREQPEPRLQTNHGLLDVFGVAELVDCFTAPRVYDGDRYYAYGEVSHQRGLTPLDAMIIDAPELEGGRFEIARKIEADLDPFTLNVITRSLEHTRTLQKHGRSGAVAKLVVRVFVIRRMKEDPDSVSVTNLDGGPEVIVRRRVLDGVRWAGFRLITPKLAELEDPPLDSAGRPHPWCLLVEDILSTT
ncbi:MAG TPA: helix-turn-helix transcriptional regulator [Polyangia bacterium]